ncbi:ribosomal subunit interface protein [Candidatus Nomurabacteria bacterium RIFCSPLOWO2_12_FULL_46_14]|uniref:Ribosomal subunit interface protein n=1 Tax=Candidatus Nomurabacteria bacterium RIFCSPLOWO2_12_FULL_46_14 TaxID=1801797 RepID=A0A1F6Y8C1_9BACT|nr:MAG: ribosomal subunit interface protein [Candidatus Nomurabacteria bacterium RIFCSPLOWO2_12_FULL_46_14]
MSPVVKINLLVTNLQLTDSIRDYVEKRITNLEKLLGKISESGGEVVANFEVAKTTNHHKSGDFFRAECLIKIDGEEFYHSAEREDLYTAIDEVNENLFRAVRKKKNKKRAMWEYGARRIKDLVKGVRNWRK